MEYKRCSVCKELLPLTEFYIRRDRDKPIARCKKCNSLASKQSKAKLTNEQKQKILKDRADWYAEQAREGNLKPILQHKMNSYKGNAKRSNVPFDITVGYLLSLYEEQEGKCYYTGEVLNIKTSGGLGKKTTLANRPNQISLDRLDPVRGYVEGNVVWCTYLINTCKNMYSEIEFYKICKQVLCHRGLLKECLDLDIQVIL